ncbi:uncharacterized protein LOC111191400, partial [Tachysurus ichikawai]
MEKDYWSASKKFWQTVRRLRKGKQCPAHTVFSGSGNLLTLTGDILGRWKEYFEDLLNPTDMSSTDEALVDSSIPQAEVTEVVEKLLGGKAPGVDEIRPEYLKSLDVVGLSWLTRLCNIVWWLGTVPLDWQTWVVVPLFKKGDRRVCSNYRGITLLSLPGKGLCQGTGEENLADSGTSDPGGTMRFSSRSWNTGPSLYPRQVAEGFMGVCPTSPHVRFALPEECEVVRMRISTSKSEAMVLSRKRVACPLQDSGELLPQVEEFKYLGVLFTSEGRMEREINRRIGVSSAVMRSIYRSAVVKRKLSCKTKLSIYQSIYVPTLTYGHELWVMTERTRSRIQAAEMSFLHRVAGRSLRDKVRSSVTREELRVEPLLLHIKRSQLRWLGHLFRIPLGRHSGEVFRACPTGRRLRGRPRTRWRDYVSQLAWECLGMPPEEL